MGIVITVGTLITVITVSFAIGITATLIILFKAIKYKRKNK